MRAAPLLIKFLVSAFALLLASGATAIDVPHIDAKIVADGKLDEPMWQQATMVTLDYESRPGENTPAPVKTEVFLAENGD